MPKIVPAGCFVPNTVDMTRSLFDWSNRGSFSKGKGQILSLTITFHTDLARGSQLLFDCHIFLLQMDPLATPTTVDAPLSFSLFPSQVFLRNKRLVLSWLMYFLRQESRYPPLGMYRVTPPRQATRSQSLLGPLYCVHSAPKGVYPWCPWNEALHVSRTELLSSPVKGLILNFIEWLGRIMCFSWR